MNALRALLLCLLAAAPASARNSADLASPQGAVRVAITNVPGVGMQYRVVFQGLDVIRPSRLGWQVDGADLGLMLSAFGTNDPSQAVRGDLNDDGRVDGLDLGVLLAGWTG